MPGMRRWRAEGGGMDEAGDLRGPDGIRRIARVARTAAVWTKLLLPDLNRPYGRGSECRLVVARLGVRIRIVMRTPERIRSHHGAQK